MPTYEFLCEECGHPFDKRLRMSEVGQPVSCPVCASKQTRRRFSSAVAVGGGSSRAAAASVPPPSSPFT
ncbi:MAG: zinc ribbon domain-containing protein [Candidatus Thermofonsia bacterium]|nr:MAG: zinc ribbon domain-containing protein [Candidatus Thermofonsia bacterium]